MPEQPPRSDSISETRAMAAAIDAHIDTIAECERLRVLLGKDD